MGNVTLAFHLLCERASPSSFWLPYIRSLPQDYNTPLYYQQGEVELLLGTQAVHDFLNQYKNTARQYAYFYKLIQVCETLPNTAVDRMAVWTTVLLGAVLFQHGGFSGG